MVSNVAGLQKNARYNFKGPEKFMNNQMCFLCEKKFAMSVKRHHW